MADCNQVRSIVSDKKDEYPSLAAFLEPIWAIIGLNNVHFPDRITFGEKILIRKSEPLDKRTWQPASSQEARSKALVQRADELRLGLRARDPQRLAFATGSAFVDGGFRLNLFTQTLFLSFPDLNAVDLETGQTMPVSVQALLLYYFTTADASPLTGRWISFAELPDGRVYNQAYQGYSGDLLARRFGTDLPGFERASLLIAGGRISYGDSGYAFLALPCVSLAAVLWQGDDEFPASCKVLFDASVIHYLPTDVCAILGSLLTGKLLKA